MIFAIPTNEAIRILNLKGEIYGGGWVESLIDSIKTSPNEFYLTFFHNCGSLSKGKKENVNYIALPSYKFSRKTLPKKNKKVLEQVIKEVNPDIIHIIGTERLHAKYIFDFFDNKKILVSITGMPSIIAPLYKAGLSDKVIRHNKTIGDILRHRGIINQQKSFKSMGNNEIELLKKCKNVMGRTEWDFVSTTSINRQIKYFFGNESLRDCFYLNESTWKKDKCLKHSIFMSQASYPLKGLHIVLEALKLVKEVYPDVVLIISGPNILNRNSLLQKLKFTNYGKIIFSIAKKYDVLNNISYIGNINGDAMVNEYKKANVTIVSSIIENKSNTLGEAMMIGSPVICSYVGGMTEMVKHGIDGFFYPYNEPNRLAYFICKLFSDTDLQEKFSKNGVNKAKALFNKESMKQNVLNAYEVIINGK